MRKIRSYVRSMVGCFSAELSSFAVQDANDTVPHSIRMAASIHSLTFFIF